MFGKQPAAAAGGALLGGIPGAIVGGLMAKKKRKGAPTSQPTADTNIAGAPTYGASPSFGG